MKQKGAGSLWRLDLDVFLCVLVGQFGRTAAPSVTVAGEVFRPGVQVGAGGPAARHVLPVLPLDAKVGGVQVQVVCGVVVLPDAATVPLAQDLAAQHGGRRHVGDVRV